MSWYENGRGAGAWAAALSRVLRRRRMTSPSFDGADTGAGSGVRSCSAATAVAERGCTGEE